MNSTATDAKSIRSSKQRSNKRSNPIPGIPRDGVSLSDTAHTDATHLQALPIVRWTLVAALSVFRPTHVPAQMSSPNDYHQHLLSPAVATLLRAPRTFTAADLIPLLDQAGVRRAVLLSMAYSSVIPIARRFLTSIARSWTKTTGPPRRRLGIRADCSPSAESTRSETMPSRRSNAVRKIPSLRLA